MTRNIVTQSLILFVIVEYIILKENIGYCYRLMGLW